MRRDSEGSDRECPRRVCVRSGKGGKPGVVDIAPPFAKLLRWYLKEVRPQLVARRPKGAKKPKAVLLGNEAKPLTRHTLRYRLLTLYRKAGLPAGRIAQLALVPPLTAQEREQLEANLLREGCRDALVVWAGHGILLDGHNRDASV